jgi:cleavage and polyadenylation specificity factor subunit 4
MTDSLGALAHVRPGEPMSMDRKNKKDQQRETREKEGGGLATPDGKSRPIPLGVSPDTDSLTSPVAIRSALSSSIQSPPASANQGMGHSPFHSGSPGRHPSSPMREPFGPPSAGGAGAGFGRSPNAGVFSSSPSRPSPLSASFSNRGGMPGSLALGKSSATVAMHSPLRPPTSAAAGSTMYSSSFSHAPLSSERSGHGHGPPLSASFADGGSLARNIWARSETPEEPLSPRRPILQYPRKSTEVFMDDAEEEDHGEDFLPASLNDLLTPQERSRRLSRRESNDSHGVSPGRPGFLLAPNQAWGGQERLAQSAGANLGPANFLQSLWDNDGVDKRRENGDDVLAPLHGMGVGPAPPAPNIIAGRQSSLLTQQRTPSSSRFGTSPIKPNGTVHGLETTYPLRPTPLPSSPSARAINEHAPGQSLPGGVATALSRLHMHDPKTSNGLAVDRPSGNGNGSGTPPTGTVPLPSAKREDHEDDDGLFAMDG